MDFVVVPTETWNKLRQIIEKVANVRLSAMVWQDEASHQEAHTYMEATLQHLEQAQMKFQEANDGGQWAQSFAVNRECD